MAQVAAATWSASIAYEGSGPICFRTALTDRLNVDFVSGSIRIEETKSGEARTLPFHALPELDALLRQLREDNLAL